MKFRCYETHLQILPLNQKSLKNIKFLIKEFILYKKLVNHKTKNYLIPYNFYCIEIIAFLKYVLLYELNQ